MLEQLIGGPSFGPDYTEADVDALATEYKVTDRKRFAEVLTILRDAIAFNREKLDCLPPIAELEEETKRLRSHLRNANKAWNNASHTAQDRVRRVGLEEVPREIISTDSNLAGSIRPPSLREEFIDSAGGSWYHRAGDRSSSPYTLLHGSSTIEIDKLSIETMLKLLLIGAEGSLATMPEKKPFSTATKHVEMAVHSLADYFVDELGGSFTSRFDDRGQPNSDAARFFQDVFALIAPHITTSNLRTHMRNVVTQRRARSAQEA